MRATVAEFVAHGFQPALFVAGETAIRQDCVIHADRLLSRMRRPPLASHVEFGIDAFDGRDPLRIARTPYECEVLVSPAEPSRPELDPRFHATRHRSYPTERSTSRKNRASG